MGSSDKKFDLGHRVKVQLALAGIQVVTAFVIGRAMEYGRRLQREADQKTALDRVNKRFSDLPPHLKEYAQQLFARMNEAETKGRKVTVSGPFTSEEALNLLLGDVRKQQAEKVKATAEDEPSAEPFGGSQFGEKSFTEQHGGPGFHG